MRFAALAADFCQQRLQFIEAAPGDAGHVTLTGKTPGNGAAGGITRADDQSDFLVLVHGFLC